MWELDVQLTRDGVCVVSHDDHLLSVFGADARISQLTAAELAHLLGGETPTFAEVAALARSRGAGVYLELKVAGTGIPAWRHLVENSQRFAALGSFNVDLVRELRDAGCDYPLAVFVPLGADATAAADLAGADIVHLCWEGGGDRPQDLVTKTLIEETERAGRHLVLWHEERPAVIADLVDLPVLGICSDRPDLLRRAGRQMVAT
jgi:glycerophosphoryl diester phosphodiesterase